MTNFAFFSSGESFTVAICAVIASGILRGYSGFGAVFGLTPTGILPMENRLNCKICIITLGGW